MNSVSFCTVAFGQKYRVFSESLINDIISREGSIFVLTDDASHYKKFADTGSVYLFEEKEKDFSFNLKKNIVRKCLEKFSAAFFLDADVRIFDLQNFDFLESIQAGLYIFNTFGSISNTFLNQDINRCSSPDQRNTKYGDMGLDFLKKHKLKYKKNYHGAASEEAPVEHFLEGKWILKKQNGEENEFLSIWDKLSVFCEQMDLELGFKNNLGAGEGANMSIAAYNSGIKLHLYSPLTKIVNSNFISNYEEKISGIKPWNIAG
jgi:hypothetical protein